MDSKTSSSMAISSKTSTINNTATGSKPSLECNNMVLGSRTSLAKAYLACSKTNPISISNTASKTSSINSQAATDSSKTTTRTSMVRAINTATRVVTSDTNDEDSVCKLSLKQKEKFLSQFIINIL